MPYPHTLSISTSTAGSGYGLPLCFQEVRSQLSPPVRLFCNWFRSGINSGARLSAHTIRFLNPQLGQTTQGGYWTTVNPGSFLNFTNLIIVSLALSASIRWHRSRVCCRVSRVDSCFISDQMFLLCLFDNANRILSSTSRSTGISRSARAKPSPSVAASCSRSVNRLVSVKVELTGGCSVLSIVELSLFAGFAVVGFEVFRVL